MSAVRLALLPLLASVLAGCSGTDTNPSASNAPLRLPCGMMNEVVRQFGATLRGTSPYVLGAYFANDGDTTVIRAPGGEGSAYYYRQSLQNICDRNFGRGPCGNPGSFDLCLAAIEIAFASGTVCGDGTCSGTESNLSFNEDTGTWSNTCPADCACGDGACEPARGENIYACEVDCPSACGDGLCSGLEVCGRCEDRPFPLPGCRQCDADCCRAACGDGVCRTDAGETRDNCEQDCSLGFCGDGVCMGGELERNCVDCFSGWNSHCLSDACLGEEPCLDAREVCGDGVCMGCEAWTCAADCGQTGFTICAANDASCPAKSCGDGTCEHPIENAMTCPLDCRWEHDDYRPPETCDDFSLVYQPELCVGDTTFVRCGDGYCSEAETITSCPDDCVPPRGRCLGMSACDGEGHMCARLTTTGPLTGLKLTQHAIVSCGASCEVIEACRDTCVSDAAGTRCVDCGWIYGELEAIGCAMDDSSRCVDAHTLSHCIPDAGAPNEPACRIRWSDPCTDTCANGTCTTEPPAACSGASCPVCGNDRCEKGETIDNCAVDCACRSACYYAGYDRDELECPAAFAACACGNHSCDNWERAGEFACPADCGGR